ncbi:MAG: sigma-70 family RNA polymerase sigma factor [Bacteroidetes bacterium]|nr:MAG: sigma-70 family RNA polymerase sigma factor [Bacteroidota bacterium]
MEVNPNLTEKAQRDFELVKQAVEHGNQMAFTELMGLYRDTIYFMLVKMTGNVDDAEDLTLEAFGKAFKNLSQYTPDYAFSTWLFKIASNNCIDFMRKKKKNVLANDNYDDVNESYHVKSMASEGLDPEENLIKSQKIELMRKVVEKLKPRYKKLIQLRYFDEYSYEEICEELDLPLGTVKAQLFRAREFLFNILKDNQERF